MIRSPRISKRSHDETAIRFRGLMQALANEFDKMHLENQHLSQRVKATQPQPGKDPGVAVKCVQAVWDIPAISVDDHVAHPTRSILSGPVACKPVPYSPGVHRETSQGARSEPSQSMSLPQIGEHKVDDFQTQDNGQDTARSFDSFHEITSGEKSPTSGSKVEMHSSSCAKSSVSSRFASRSSKKKKSEMCKQIVARNTVRDQYRGPNDYGLVREREEHLEPRKLHEILLDVIPGIVIVVNSLTMGISAEFEDERHIWNVLEVVFVMCYFLEALCKMSLYTPIVYFTGPDKLWNWFDFIMLGMGFADLFATYVVKEANVGSGQQLLKVFRLARLGRLVRMLHFRIFDELKQMVLGVVAGLRVLAWAIVLLVTTIYTIGIALNNLVGDEVPEFRTVPNSMMTVFRCYTDGCSRYNGTPLHTALFEMYGAPFFIGYILVFMVVTVGIFNLIMAIFIDNVVSASVRRKLTDIGATADKTETLIRDTIGRLLSGETDEIFDMEELEELGVAKEEFVTWLESQDMVEMLETADIEISNKAELFDVLDVDMGGELGYNELITGLMKLRGPITKSDIVAVRLKSAYITGMIEDIWKQACLMTGCSDRAVLAARFDELLPE